MFCNQCGTKNLDAARFCENCGASLEGMAGTPTFAEAPVYSSAPASGGNAFLAFFSGIFAAFMGLDKKFKAIIAAGLATIILIVGVLVVVNVGSGSPEAPIKNMVKAINNADANAAVKTLPKFMAKEYDKEDKVWIKEELKDTKEEYVEYYGKGKFKYEVLSKEKLPKYQLDDLRYELISWYGESCKVSAGYEMVVHFKYKGSYDEWYDVRTIYVYKINGKWCCLDMDYIW